MALVWSCVFLVPGIISMPTLSWIPERLLAVIGSFVLRFSAKKSITKLCCPCAAPPFPCCCEGIPERPLPILSVSARERRMDAWI